MEEYDEVLHRAKFSFSEQGIRRILQMIRQFGLAVNPGPTGEILVDMNDLVFYEKIYIMSGEIGLYEKYGFTKLGDFETIYGTIDQLFVKPTLL